MNSFQEINEVADAKAARKRRQAFYTPLQLCKSIVEVASVWPSARVLEPSAGDGRLVHMLREAGAEVVDACEIETSLHHRIEAAGGRIIGIDFLKYQPEHPYHLIVMNPPFTGRQVKKHLEHAWSMLADEGQILSVAPWQMWEDLYRCSLDLPGCTHATCEGIDTGVFKEFGTGIKTILIELCRYSDRDHDGFRNWATWNAAISIDSCAKLQALARQWKTPKPLQDNLSIHLIKSDQGVAAQGRYWPHLLGGSCYGVDWKQVRDYLHRDRDGLLSIEPETSEAIDAAEAV